MRVRPARPYWVVSTAILLVTGLGLFLAAVTPWVAPVAVLMVLSLAIGQRTSWPFAVAASVIVLLALIAIVVRFLPSTGLGLVEGSALLLALLGVGGLVAFSRSPEPRLVGARALRIGVPVVAVPVLLIAFVGARSVYTGDLEWAMQNDAVWNLVTTRLIVGDGGLDAIAHPNASPLTPGLLAVSIAVGRDGIAPADLLAHDVGRAAGFWLVATLGAGMLAALIGARSVHGGSKVARMVGATIAAFIPFSWFTFGFAAQLGFYNAPVTILLLLATWLAWLEVRVSPVAGVAVLSLATVAMLATWAPLAILPSGLAAAALVSRLRVLHRGRRGLAHVGFLLLCGAPIIVYVLAVTLPDLRRDGSALAVDGGIMALEPAHVLVIVAVTLGVTVITAVQHHNMHQLRGLLVVCAGGAIAAGYLSWQRIAAGASAWGYYPAKFSWLLASLLLVILAAAIAGEMAGLRGRRLAAVGVAVAAAAVPVALMLLVPPPSAPRASVLTPVAILTNSGIAGGSPAARHLFELAAPGERTIVYKYLDPVRDKFINSWLLQLESTTAADPIRTFAYVLQPDDPAQACEAARTWAAPVRIVTGSDAATAELIEPCRDADVTIDVRHP